MTEEERDYIQRAMQCMDNENYGRAKGFLGTLLEDGEIAAAEAGN